MCRTRQSNINGHPHKVVSQGPRIHSNFGTYCFTNLGQFRHNCPFTATADWVRRPFPHIWYRGIAQPGRAPALGAGGPVFESPCPDQKDRGRWVRVVVGSLLRVWRCKRGLKGKRRWWRGSIDLRRQPCSRDRRAPNNGCWYLIPMPV